MNISKEIIKKALLKKGYKWYDDRPNIIGIRSSMNIPNVFNDVECLFIDKTNTEKYYPITTDPGTTYLINPINPKGCFVLKPGQYIDCWHLGYHHQKKDHRALRQCGTMTGYRDNDKDGIIEMVPGTEETATSFGVNNHGATKNIETKNVGPWSAGCQVFASWKHKEEFIDILCEWEKANKSFWKKITSWIFGTSGIKYSYTLLDEKDLV